MKYILLITMCSLMLLSACTLYDFFFENIGENELISECGGFDKKSITRDDDYCADERLTWEYDQESGSVHFCNENVWLNCCGKHSITIKKEQNVYIIDEKDKPESLGGRCDCMCFFDFAIDMPDIQPGTILVELYRHITDQGERTIVWQGEINPGEIQGDILIQADVGWCE